VGSISFATLIAVGLCAVIIYAIREFRLRQPTLADEINELLAAPSAPVVQPLQKLRQVLHGEPPAAATGKLDIDGMIDRLNAQKRGAT
jgi:hypothetical protein